MPPSTQPSRQFARLVDIMAALRSPEGCPWDRDQTLRSLAQFVLEEAYEVVDAIERNDLEALREEIGDHIFEGVFLAQIASDRGARTVGCGKGPGALGRRTTPYRFGRRTEESPCASRGVQAGQARGRSRLRL